MKRRTKLSVSVLSLFIACFVMTNSAAAQWSIGASYQIRNAQPKKGFGVKIQRQILTSLPLVDIGIRARFSYFNEDNNLSENGVSFGKVSTSYYDFGVDAVGGIGLGILEPYIGIGIGSNKYKFDFENLNSESDSQFYWNTFIGAELTLLPVLHPFIEYRFMPTDSPQFGNNINFDNGINFDSDGRLVIGLVLSF